jgi:hypothetical protein
VGALLFRLRRTARRGVPVSDVDGLRLDGLSTGERIAVWLAINAPEIREPYRLGQELADWAERQARERAAEELRAHAERVMNLWEGRAIESAFDAVVIARNDAAALADDGQPT